MSAWDSDYYDDEEEYEMVEDEDYQYLSCPGCQEPVLFGEFLVSKDLCVFCAEDLELPLKPLLELVRNAPPLDS